jgi:hypothetical protein
MVSSVRYGYMLVEFGDGCIPLAQTDHCQHWIDAPLARRGWRIVDLPEPKQVIETSFLRCPWYSLVKICLDG